MTTRPAMPASFFGIPVGILGLAGAWHVGVRIWNLPPLLADAITVFGALVWLVLLVLYARKWYWDRAAAQQEARDPVQSSFVSLGLISTMLVSIGALQVSRSAGMALFAVVLAVQLALGLWLLGRIWQGGHGADFVTPALYLPAVGQNFVAANVAAAFEWPQIAAWLFGCGALSWLATESVVLARAATREPMPALSRPAIGVQLAPPVVGGLAYLSLTAGRPDLAAHMLFGYGLFQAALLLRLWPWIRLPSFSPTYWSISFGVTALPTMAMRMVERGDSGPMTWAAPILFTGANLVIVYLLVSTLRLLVKGRLFLPAAAAPMPSTPSFSTGRRQA
jgi:tellurite resistance protein